MARKKKVTTYIDEDLLRSVRTLASRNDGKIYEVFNEALRRYLKEVDAVEPPLAEPSLAEALSARRTRRQPGTPDEEAPRLLEGETLSEAVIAERESRDY
jgi:hypothetical protein